MYISCSSCSVISILTLTKKLEHITITVCKLHWLPVLMRIKFKVLCMFHKALFTHISPHFLKLLCLYSPSTPGVRLVLNSRGVYPVVRPTMAELRLYLCIFCVKKYINYHVYFMHFLNFHVCILLCVYDQVCVHHGDVYFAGI